MSVGRVRLRRGCSSTDSTSAERAPVPERPARNTRPELPQSLTQTGPEGKAEPARDPPQKRLPPGTACLPRFGTTRRRAQVSPPPVGQRPSRVSRARPMAAAAPWGRLGVRSIRTSLKPAQASVQGEQKHIEHHTDDQQQHHDHKQVQRNPPAPDRGGLIDRDRSGGL